MSSFDTLSLEAPSQADAAAADVAAVAAAAAAAAAEAAALARHRTALVASRHRALPY